MTKNKELDNNSESVILTWCERHPASCQTLASFFGAFLGAVVVLWTTYAGIQSTLEASRQSEETSLNIARIGLMRDLIKDYDSHPEYKKIHSAIIECSALLPLRPGETEDKGYLDWQDVNSFLGFLDDVGFFWRSGALDLESADHLFGSLLREVYLHEDVKRYVSQLHSQAGESEALNDFQQLAEKLISMSKHSAHVANFKGRSCRKDIAKPLPKLSKPVK